MFNLLSHNCLYFGFNAEDDVPSKAAKVDIPPTQLVGGMRPPPLGTGYPPRSAMPAIPPVYVTTLCQCLYLYSSSLTQGGSCKSYIFYLFKIIRGTKIAHTLNSCDIVIIQLYPCHQMLGWFRLDHSHGFHNLQLFQFLLLPHTHSSHYFLCRMSGLHCQQLLQQHCKLRLLLLDCLHLHRSQFHNLCSLLLETTIQRLKVQHILLHLCPQVFHQLLQ